MERLESRNLLAGLPFGATAKDTGEYMLGDVYVTVVFMESSSQTSAINNNSENWNAGSIAATKQKVAEGLQWWEDTLAAITTRHHLDFQLDFTYADNPVLTNYEPITRPSTDVQFWIYDFLNVVGFNRQGNFHDDIRAFNDAQRQAHGADWAFTIFVVHDENDADHQFAPGGFARAFAFAGGELLVSPSSRPPSTFAHETGHQFWALDEYASAGDYDRFRGYYNTQNVNAADNPTPGFVQQPSIMTNGTLLDTAYANHTSAASTLEMIGWKDSDGDGVFDVLDVPLTLTGSGAYDVATGRYRFTGHSSVQTLPNRNPSGLGNDITLNKVSRAEYRIDGGAWQTAAVYGTPTAELNLDFAVPATANEIEIRTKDDVTGITSAIFRGTLTQPAGVLLPGVNGIVWDDLDRDGEVDGNEAGLEGATVRLVDPSGQPVVLRQTIEPDNYASETRLNDIAPGVTISAVGSGVSINTVFSRTASQASTGSRVLAPTGSTEWLGTSRQLRIDFATPVSSLQLDAIGASLPGYGRLEVYGTNNELLARYTTRQLAAGEVEAMTLNRPAADIKYAIARGHNDSMIRFDHLRFGPESTAVTDARGAYSLPYLGAGTYTVEVVTAAGQFVTSDQESLTVTLANHEARGDVNFGLGFSPNQWQNPRNRFDVNGDGAVAPLDALVIINSLNRSGVRSLTAADVAPPYLDVNGDLLVTPFDVLHVINELNRNLGGGEAESYVAAAMDGASGVDSHPALPGEGEQAGNPSAISERAISDAGGTLRGLAAPWTAEPLSDLASSRAVERVEFRRSAPQGQVFADEGWSRLSAAATDVYGAGELDCEREQRERHALLSSARWAAPMRGKDGELADFGALSSSASPEAFETLLDALAADVVHGRWDG